MFVVDIRLAWGADKLEFVGLDSRVSSFVTFSVVLSPDRGGLATPPGLEFVRWLEFCSVNSASLASVFLG